MTCSYQIHSDLQTLHCVFGGRLGLREIVDLADRAARDPALETGTSVIADFLRMTRLDMDWSGRREALNRLAALTRWEGPPRSIAILIQGEPGWSIAGSLEASITLKSPIVFQRFRTPADALTFVGIDPRQYAERFGYAPVP